MSYSPARVDEPAKSETETPKPEDVNAKPVTPGWFSDAYPAETPDQLAERYRVRNTKEEDLQNKESAALEDYRRKLDERIKHAIRIYDRPQNDNAYDTAHGTPYLSARDNPPEPPLRATRPTLPLTEINGRTKRYRLEQSFEKSKVQQKRSHKTNGIGTYVAYSAVALLLGSAAGFGVANRDQVMGIAHTGFAKVTDYVAWTRASATPPAILAETTGQSTITKKPVTMASLAVNDVRGTLNSMIPLTLQATPAAADQTLDLKITGLPKTAYLTKGQQTVSGDWIVKAAEVENIKLFVPQSETPKLNLEVAAIESGTNTIATPAQSMSVELSDVKIMPTAAAPDGVDIKSNAIPEPITSATTEPGADLLVKAQELMNQGDVASARQFYLQASGLGNAKGTFGVARTYDPKTFAELKIEGLQPDPAKADEWYKKAAAAGITAQN